jgi:hypothetical protein
MGFALPAEPAGHNQHLVNEPLMLADKDRADLDASRRFGARLCEGAEQSDGRGAQTAERLFLQPMADGPRQEILGEGGWRIGRERLPPANAQLIDIHLGDTRERGAERLSRRRRPGRLSSRGPAESQGQATAAGAETIR